MTFFMKNVEILLKEFKHQDMFVNLIEAIYPRDCGEGV